MSRILVLAKGEQAKVAKELGADYVGDKDLIDKIKSDYENLNSDVRFNNYYTEIYECNEKLEATKSFYNKYTNLLNKTIKKFPPNIIAFIHHIKVQTFFDGKDMFDDDINDFKL